MLVFLETGLYVRLWRLFGWKDSFTLSYLFLSPVNPFV